MKKNKGKFIFQIVISGKTITQIVILVFALTSPWGRWGEIQMEKFMSNISQLLVQPINIAPNIESFPVETGS